MNDVTIIHGDCIEAMAELEADSVDAIVTDPPYGLGFMGKEWDDLPPGLDWAKQCYRVLKPGGHILAFGGTRTWHRLAVAVEDAGFEIRDSIAWLYGSGFSKAGLLGNKPDAHLLDPKFHGFSTTLKPAFEPIAVGRKPLAAGTVAANVLTHGTGALNIDACRIEASDPGAYAAKGASVVGLDSNRNGAAYGEWTGKRTDSTSPDGRWPANVILDDDQAAALDEQSGYQKDGVAVQRNGGGRALFGGIAGNKSDGARPDDAGFGGGGGASRFFYCAKAPKRERPVVIDADGKTHSHATVKPLALMRWLVRLVTPPGGVVLDPFAGSGTTIEAAMLEGFRVIGIERGGAEGTPESHYLAMIQQRIDRARAARIAPNHEPDLFEDEESA